MRLAPSPISRHRPELSPGPEIELGPKPQKSPDKEDAAASRNSELAVLRRVDHGTHQNAPPSRPRDPATGVAIEEKGGLLIVMRVRPCTGLLANYPTLRKAGKVNVAIKGLLVPAAMIPRNTIFTHDEIALKALEPGGVAGALASPRVFCANGQRMHSALVRASSFSDVAIAGNALNPTWPRRL